MIISPKFKIKNLIFFLINILIAIFLFFPILFVRGQGILSSSPAALLTKTADDNDVKTFKEKIATKVAQLQQKNNKAISGYVNELDEKNLKIQTRNRQTYEIKLDQLLTKYYQIKGSQQIEIKPSDIKKSDYIIAAGIISDKTVDANFIFVDESFAVLSGKVVELDKENYVLKVLTNDGDIYFLDVEVTTKQEIINIKTLEIERGGFSKIKEGDIIHFVVKETGQSEKKDKYLAQKILIIPQEYFMK